MISFFGHVKKNSDSMAKCLKSVLISSPFTNSGVLILTNLTSLQLLNLSSNELTSLPESMWKLNNLDKIWLYDNPWDTEWEDIAKRDAPAIIEFSRLNYLEKN